jgi:6-pyruvoyltetrahydropterin/6-carboxytetrahydropterin synthase
MTENHRWGRDSVTWKIVIAGGNLSFSAAHFITLGDTYEPLHGHNYGLSAEIAGDELTSDGYLLDFGEVKDLLRDYIAEVNHHFLLPLHNPSLRVAREGDEWEIRLPDGARIVLPAFSVVPLAIDNVTAERLAEYFAGKLRDDLRAHGATNVRTITLGVAETEMQTAFHTLHIPPA